MTTKKTSASGTGQTTSDFLSPARRAARAGKAPRGVKGVGLSGGVTFRTTRRSNRVELRVGMTRTRWWAAATETRRIAVAKNPDACVDAQGIEVAAERQARGNRAPSHLSSRVRIAAIDMKTVSATADRTRLSPRTSR